MIAAENCGEKRMVRVCSLPGTLVPCGQGLSAAWVLRQEVRRFFRCFPWYGRCEPYVFVAAEHTVSRSSEDPGITDTVLASDLDKTPEELRRMIRLLLESCMLLEDCYCSLPDADYDYTDGMSCPAWRPVSGRDARMRFLMLLSERSAVWLPEKRAFSEENWCGELRVFLEEMQQRDDFMQNRLFWSSVGAVCAAHWLRHLTEACHLTGARLYELGVSSFGCNAVRDTFHWAD